MCTALASSTLLTPCPHAPRALVLILLLVLLLLLPPPLLLLLLLALLTRRWWADRAGHQRQRSRLLVHRQRAPRHRLRAGGQLSPALRRGDLGARRRRAELEVVRGDVKMNRARLTPPARVPALLLPTRAYSYPCSPVPRLSRASSLRTQAVSPSLSQSVLSPPHSARHPASASWSRSVTQPRRSHAAAKPG